jgi:hypothetical protein
VSRTRIPLTAADRFGPGSSRCGDQGRRDVGGHRHLPNARPATRGYRIVRTPDLVPLHAPAHRGALQRFTPVWCGVVLLTVAMTVTQTSGVVLATLWIATWLVSSVGLGLIVLADEQGCGGHHPATRLARR